MHYLMKRLTPVLIAILFSACREERVDAILTGMENKPLPAFDILLPDSTTYLNTTNISPGKNLVLFYYSPTCPYCRAQMRETLNNISQFKEEQLCVLIGGDFRSMKEFSQYFMLQKYPNVIVGIDTGFIVARNYAIPGVPFTAIFDKNKLLKSAYVGRLPKKTLLNVTRP